MSRSKSRPTTRARGAPPTGAAASSGARAPDEPRDADAADALAALRRIVRALRLSAVHAEAKTGLTGAQLFVLAQVAESPGLSLTEVAERTLTDRTSVAAVVARLVTKGLVRTGRSTGDRRRVEVRASPAGRATLARAPHPPTRLVLDGMATLDDRDLRALATGLSRLADAMGLVDGPAPMLFEERLGEARTATGRAIRR